MKRILTTIAATLPSLLVIAQDTRITGKTFGQDPLSHPMFPVFAVTFFGITVLILLIATGIYLMRAIHVLKTAEEPGITAVSKASGKSVRSRPFKAVVKTQTS